MPGIHRSLAIDPGKCTGWSLFSTSGTLLACGVGEPPVDDIDRVAVEIPQFYPKKPVPVSDLIQLAYRAGIIIGSLRAREILAFFPHEWKGTLPKDVCESRIRRKLNPDERLVVEECERYVPRSLMNNVWDAIGIGLYAWRGGIS